MLLSAPLIVVGGKGGVGKSSIAASVSLMLADKGGKTLLISTDPAHNLVDLTGKKIGARPTRVAKNLDCMELDPQRETKKYIGEIRKKMGSFVHAESYGRLKKYLEGIAETPGAHESAILEALSIHIENYLPKYSHIVLDTAPSGHTLRLLQMPAFMAGWISSLAANRLSGLAEKRKWESDDLDESSASGDSGDSKNEETTHPPKDEINSDKILAGLHLKGRRFQWLSEILRDPARCLFFIVANPERLSYLESKRLAAALGQAGIPSKLIINKIWPNVAEPFLKKMIEEQKVVLKNLRKEFGGAIAAEVPVQSEPVLRLAGLRLLHKYFGN